MDSEHRTTPYPDVPKQSDFPALERQVLDYWHADGSFVASLEARAAGEREFVFYDGPPFANGYRTTGTS